MTESECSKTVVHIVAVVVMMSPSSKAYMRMHRSNEEFHQIHVVLKYISDVNAVTEMMPMFHWPLKA